jgi:hypothetical protein
LASTLIGGLLALLPPLPPASGRWLYGAPANTREVSRPSSEAFAEPFSFRDLGQHLVERPLREMNAIEVLWAWRWQWGMVSRNLHRAPHWGGALGLSFAKTFGFLGIRKDLIDPGLLQGLPGWLKVTATIQTILGIVLLFLFGLSIRNRFRMK